VTKSGLVLGLSVAGLGVLVPAFAQAHFILNAPTSWWSQASDGSPQKMAPCGDEATTGTSASKMVTTVQSGQTVAVQVTATVAHPGWYRISLKQGASATQTATAFPDPPTLGASGSAQQCTPAFIDNPVWSPTQPVLADKLGLPSGSTSTTTVQSGMKTFNVTIPPTATCSSASPCTLQVLMFMTDHPAGSCNYHHCADIALAGGGTGGAGAGGHGGAAGTSGGAKGGAGGSSSGTGGTTVSTGGASGAAGAGGEPGGTGGAHVSGSGGTNATGGTPGTGGTGSGGTNATGGTTGGSTGGAGAPAGDGAGGCSYSAARNAGGKLGIAVVLVLAVAAARRRGRRRRP
jgi:hypothetical protein